MTDRGSALPMVLGVVAAAIILLVLAVDVTLYAAATREAAHVADAGARAGAAQIDASARYQGVLAVDTAAAALAATEAATTARPRVGRVVQVAATSARVCVTVQQPFDARLVAVTDTVSVTACAVPAEG